MHKTKKALISGMHGFIGSHLVKALKERDITSIAIPQRLLYSLSALQSFLSSYEPAYVFALHAYGNHGMQKQEERIIITNYFATWILLQATKFLPYEAFINFSTSSIYGHQDKAMTEDTAPKPDFFYAAAKAGAMYLARTYAKQYSKPIVSVIPFSVFGEGEADWRYIPTICKHLVSGKPMPIAGNQEQTHDWIYIDNLIEGVLTVADKAQDIQGAWVNIGMGEKQTNREIREMLEKIAGRKLQLDIGGFKEQSHHSSMWVADNSKLVSLGWKPKVSLEEGLRRTWEYYKVKYDEK